MSDERSGAIDSAIAQIERKFGAGAVMRMDDQARDPIPVVSTGSLSIDLALGVGGLPRGRVVEVFGPESSGKTTLALHAVAEAQRRAGRRYSRTWSTRWTRPMPKSSASTSPI